MSALPPALVSLLVWLGVALIFIPVFITVIAAFRKRTLKGADKPRADESLTRHRD